MDSRMDDIKGDFMSREEKIRKKKKKKRKRKIRSQ